MKHNATKLENCGLVVFGHSPRNPIDALDGVPNELRYLSVTDYIYRNFSPCTVVNGYRIWMPIEDGLAMEDSTKMLPVLQDDLRNWPSYLGRTSHFIETSEVVLAGNEVLLFNHSPNIHDAFFMEFESFPENVTHSAWVQYFDRHDKLIGEVKFKLFETNNQAKFVAPIGYQYNWQTKEMAKIEIHYPGYLTLKSVKLVRYEP